MAAGFGFLAWVLGSNKYMCIVKKLFQDTLEIGIIDRAMQACIIHQIKPLFSAGGTSIPWGVAERLELRVMICLSRH